MLTPIELRLAKGETVAVHCRQGLGRAPLIAACLLVLAGVNANDAFQRIGNARGTAVPETRTQAGWPTEFAQKGVVPRR